MSGNVWEWTASLWGKNLEKPDYGYPYDSRDGREYQRAGDNVLRIVRGGSFVNAARAAMRRGGNLALENLGFRIALAPILS